MYNIGFSVKDQQLDGLLVKLKKVYEQTKKVNKALNDVNTRSYKDLSKAVSNVSKTLTNYENRLQKLEQSQKRSNAQAAQGNKSQSRFATSLKNSDQMTAVYRASLHAAGTSMGMFSAKTIVAASAAYGLVTAVRSMITAGADFSAEMSRAFAVMTTAQSDMDNVSQSVLRVSEVTKYTATEVATGYTALGMAGLSTKEALDALQPSLALASIGQLNMYKSADILTDVMNGFGIAASGASSVADDLATAVTSSTSTIAQMGNALSYVAPVARAAGASIETTVAMLEVLHNAGIKGSRAGTTIRRAYANLIDPTSEAAAVLRQLGVSVYASNGRMKDMIVLVDDLAKAGADLKDIKEIFGIWAFPGMTKLIEDMRSAEPELLKFKKALEGNTDSAENMRKTIEDNLTADTNKLFSMLTSKYNKVFESIEPTLRNSVQRLTSYIESFDTTLISEFAQAVVDLTVFMAENSDVILTAITAYAGFKILKGTAKLFTEFGSFVGAAATKVNRMHKANKRLFNQQRTQAMSFNSATYSMATATTIFARANVAAAGAVTGLKVAIRGFLAATGIGLVLTAASIAVEKAVEYIYDNVIQKSDKAKDKLNEVSKELDAISKKSGKIGVEAKKDDKQWKPPLDVTTWDETDRDKMVDLIWETPSKHPKFGMYNKILQDYDDYVMTGLTPELKRRSAAYMKAIEGINRGTLSERVKTQFAELQTDMKAIDLEKTLGGVDFEGVFNKKSAAIAAHGKTLVAEIKQEIANLQEEFQASERFSEGRIQKYKEIVKAQQDLAQANVKLREAQRKVNEELLKVPQAFKVLQSSKQRNEQLQQETQLLLQNKSGLTDKKASLLQYLSVQTKSRVETAKTLGIDGKYVALLDKLSAALHDVAVETQYSASINKLAATARSELTKTKSVLNTMEAENKLMRESAYFAMDSAAKRTLVTAAILENKAALLELESGETAELKRLREMIELLRKRANLINQQASQRNVLESFRSGAGMTEEDKAEVDYKQRLALYQSYLDNKLVSDQQYNEAVNLIEQERFDKQNQMLASLRDNLSNSIADNIGKFASLEQSGTDTFRAIGASIRYEVVRALVQKGSQMAINAVMTKVFAAKEIATEKTVAAAKVAAEATKQSATVATAATSQSTASGVISGLIGQGAAMSAAWWPAATAVSLATFGANAAPASAGILAVSAMSALGSFVSGVAGGAGSMIGGYMSAAGGGGGGLNTSPSVTGNTINVGVPSSRPATQAQQQVNVQETVTYNVEITAVDSQSVERLFQENSDLLYALNEHSKRKFLG